MQPATNSELQWQTRAITTKLPLLFALVLSLTQCFVSVKAETSHDPSPIADAATAAPQTAQPRRQNRKSFVTHVPLTMLSFVVGTAIGTPIALVRCTRIEVKKRTKEAYDLGGVRPKPLAYLSAGFFGIPSGILSGAWSGALNGVSDSLKNSKEVPFSRDCFSLEKLELYK